MCQYRASIMMHASIGPLQMLSECTLGAEQECIKDIALPQTTPKSRNLDCQSFYICYNVNTELLLMDI